MPKRSAIMLEEQLKYYSTEELMSEIARRHRALAYKAEPAVLCNGCMHEQFWRGRGEVPARFNTCSLGHALEFQMPGDDDPHADGAGFFRPGGCSDRAEPPAPDHES